MSDIRCCSEHGYFDTETCPVCGDEGTHVLSSSKRKQVSKFISDALRHFPGDVGLDLDGAGWTSKGLLIDQTKQKYDWIDVEAIEAIVATDPKGRFEVDGERIRAAYGHSVGVELEAINSPVPRNLYQGTAPENVTVVLSDGLRPMSRQHVHLTDSVEEAKTVGERHGGDAVVLEIDAARMLSDGWDVTKRGETVYTTERVPPVYISRTK